MKKNAPLFISNETYNRIICKSTSFTRNLTVAIAENTSSRLSNIFILNTLYFMATYIMYIMVIHFTIAQIHENLCQCMVFLNIITCIVFTNLRLSFQYYNIVRIHNINFYKPNIVYVST